MSDVVSIPAMPVLVTRGLAIVSGGVAAALAYPHLSPWFLLLGIGLAAFPRTWAPTALMALVALLWLLESEQQPTMLTPIRVCGLALALYAFHVSSALAAALPHDGHPDRGLFAPSLRRASVVIVLTIAVTLLVMSMEALAHGVAVTTVGWAVELVAGLLLAIAAGFFLIRFGHRG